MHAPLCVLCTRGHFRHQKGGVGESLTRARPARQANHESNMPRKSSLLSLLAVLLLVSTASAAFKPYTRAAHSFNAASSSGTRPRLLPRFEKPGSSCFALSRLSPLVFSITRSRGRRAPPADAHSARGRRRAVGVQGRPAAGHYGRLVCRLFRGRRGRARRALLLVHSSVTLSVDYFLWYMCLMDDSAMFCCFIMRKNCTPSSCLRHSPVNAFRRLCLLA